MTDKAFILRQQPYSPNEGYALELQWEKPLLPIAETESGPFPDPLIFEGNIVALADNDYPSNSFHWPIMSRRMLNILLSVGHFPHRAVPVGVRDKQTKQLDTEKYVAIQLTEHLDLFDAQASKYYYPYGDSIRFINTDEDEKIYQSRSLSYKTNKILSQVALKVAEKPLPAIFRLVGYRWTVFITEAARAVLDKQSIKGVVFQELDRPRNIVETGNASYSFLETSADLVDFQLSPGELNAFIYSYNWDDDDNDVLLQIVKHPFCDRATALMIYWKAEPTYYLQYENENQIADYQIEHYHLVKEIERRYQNDFYYYKTLFYDPKNDYGYDWTEASSSDKIAPGQKIPDIMYEATGPR